MTDKEKELQAEAIDYYRKQIASLEKENAELKDKLNNLASVAEVRLANWQKYEKENAELNKECRRCVHTDCPCILSDYGKDRNGICDHFEDVFDVNIELKEENADIKEKRDYYKNMADTANKVYNENLDYSWYLEGLLTQSKDLLKKLCDETRGYINDQGFDIKILTDVEQFLNSLLSNF